MGFRYCVATGLIAIACGCGGGGAETPELVSVEGTVTIDGSAKEGVEVTFAPVSGGRSSFGTTDSDGHYALNYQAGTPGVIPGQCRVVLYRNTEVEGADGISVQDGPEIPDEYASGDKMVDVDQSTTTFDFAVITTGN